MIKPIDDTTTDDIAGDLDETITNVPTLLDFDEATTEPQNIIINSIQSENEIFKFGPSIGSTDTIDDSTETESSSDAAYVVPLKIILPVEHVHKSSKNDSFERFNYILLKVDDVSYHEHIFSDNSDLLFPLDKNTAATPTSVYPSIDSNTEDTTMTSNIFDSDENGSTANQRQQQQQRQRQQSNRNDNKVLVDSEGYRYELGKQYKILNEFGTAVVEFNDLMMVHSDASTNGGKTANKITKRILTTDDEAPKSNTEPPEVYKNSDLHEKHYERIFQWLHYRLWQ